MTVGILSATSVFKNVSNMLEIMQPGRFVDSIRFRHPNFPGISFHLRLYPAGSTSAQRGLISLYLKCAFDTAQQARLVSVWVWWTCGIFKPGNSAGAEDVAFGPQYKAAVRAFTAKHSAGMGFPETWRHEEFRSGIRADGTLHVKLELHLYGIADLVNERSLALPMSSLQVSASDFKILVNGKEYRVHQSLLAECSSVIARMIHNGMQESKDKVLNLEKTTTNEAVEAFLGALYQKSWEFLGNVDLAIAVLELADKYDFQHIKTFCEAALMEMKNTDSVFDILFAADKFQAPQIKADCIEFISSNDILDVEFLESASWKKFMANHATKHLAQETVAGIIKGFDEKQKRRATNRQEPYKK